jgi:glycosyltransferase involved in cell wall biosynthesis
MIIVVPSKWLAALAKESMLGSFPIIHVPYGIDTSTFKPWDRIAARSKLGLARTKRIIMFAAENLNDWRKGGDLLIRALDALPKSLKTECLLLLIGRKTDSFKTISGIETVSLGYVWEDVEKAIAYSAADVFVLPTLADNQPLVLLESMACGTPMVSFAVGGVEELVISGETGYLARPQDWADLALGISQLLEDASRPSKVSEQCRRKAVTGFDISFMVGRYRGLYEEITSMPMAQTASTTCLARP